MCKKLLENHKDLTVAGLLKLIEEERKDKYAEFENAYLLYECKDSTTKVDIIAVKVDTVEPWQYPMEGCTIRGEGFHIWGKISIRKGEVIRLLTDENLKDVRKITKEQFNTFKEAYERMSKEIKQFIK